MVAMDKSPFFDPRCCTYKLSGNTRNHVDKLINSKDVESDLKSSLEALMDEDEANKNTLVYDSLVELHKYIQRADPDYIEPFYLFSDSCKCIEPKPRENEQLDFRLKMLRFKTSQAMYDTMTASIDRCVEDKLERVADGKKTCNLSSSTIYSNLNSNSSNDNNNNVNQTHLSEFKRLNGSLVAVFNSFLVFVCTFIFCYKALEYALPTPNIVAQVLFGVGGSTIVAIAELYFLMRVV